MARKPRFPLKRKFGGKTFHLHSQYIAGRAKTRAEGQKKRYKKQGYNARIVESGGDYALYLNKLPPGHYRRNK